MKCWDGESLISIADISVEAQFYFETERKSMEGLMKLH